ncbi:hypothetical protein GOP47_0014289 [Adiantum capillus-veneris]|uniref:Serine aminopeptidase S33 domain-containing protein n=1 Tax=Adiantum capillus-veneris TaxID=13818 RepID=A0A9D4UM17_ADICA|nr:hypothetical protein GOP47_0014289 [Adiantum capillus-veneris]
MKQTRCPTVFESIEVEEEDEQSNEGSRSLRRARVLWARSSSCDAAQRRVLAHKLRLTKPIDETVTSWQTHLFLNSRKQTLFAQSWMPAAGNKTRGLLILLHGLNEHSGRYLHFARQLNLQGYGVYAMDWIGHGGSDGLHGYVPSLDYVVTDTKAFFRWVVERNPGLPCFLFGHSTGGAVALKAACQLSMESLLKGIILTSPALRVRPTHPVFEVIAPVFSMLLPTLQFKGANKRGIPVSRDPAQLAAKYSDPLVYTGPLRIRTGSEILRITVYLQRNMEKVTVPFMVMHGTGDKITDPAASQDLYFSAASKHKKLKLYDGIMLVVDSFECSVEYVSARLSFASPQAKCIWISIDLLLCSPVITFLLAMQSCYISCMILLRQSMEEGKKNTLSSKEVHLDMNLLFSMYVSAGMWFGYGSVLWDRKRRLSGI